MLLHRANVYRLEPTEEQASGERKTTEQTGQNTVVELEANHPDEQESEAAKSDQSKGK